MIWSWLLTDGPFALMGAGCVALGRWSQRRDDRREDRRIMPFTWSCTETGCNTSFQATDPELVDRLVTRHREVDHDHA